MLDARNRLGMAFVSALAFLALSQASLSQTAPAPQTAPSVVPPPPSPAPVEPAPVVPGDPFGEEVTVEAKAIVFMKGTATWETAFETLLDAFKSVNGYLEKQKLARAGEPVAIYTKMDETGFNYQVGIPIPESPKNPPRGDLAVGKSPNGKMLKFVHRGSYDAMDTTYEAITNHLDEKRLESENMFIEEYVTDPLKTSRDKLIVNVYVPLK